MTQATKQAPTTPSKAAPAGPSTPVATAPKPKVTLDFSQVTAGLGEPGEKIVNARGGVNPLDGTPVRQWVAQSNTEGRMVKAQVPTAAVDAVKSLVRRAADEIGKGVRFGQAAPVQGKTGVVVLPFEVKIKKVMDTSPEAVAARKAKRAENKAAKGTVTK